MRLRVEVQGERPVYADLAHDVRHGLQLAQKRLPPKYFYDDRGAELFDAICNLPEYYLTRTEEALLRTVATDIVAVAQPDTIVELGSGSARKTRILLDATQHNGQELRYAPIDLSQGALRHAAFALLRDYPELHIHAVVGDYEDGGFVLPPGRHRLVVFLGSTIGNFSPPQTAQFLAMVRSHLGPDDFLLLGVDLLKAVAVIEAAYNDTAGVTAEFNRNVLRVINRELGGDFDPMAFDHLAFFNPRESQIEMHLRARHAHTVRIRDLRLTVPFRKGETIHTEISRKFTAAEVDRALTEAGFAVSRWYAAPGNAFGLALARAA